jgi:hypothetical protein
MKTLFQLIFAFILAFQFGCSSTTKSPNGILEATSIIWTDATMERDKKLALDKAINECSKDNLIADVMDQGRRGSVKIEWVVRFICITPAEKQLLEQSARDRRQRAIDRENRMKAEAAERERKRQDSIAAEQRRREEEWERGRPQREAEARKAQEAERKRLDGICPLYWTARQSCAVAPDLERCMRIRIGKGYSSWDDEVCFRR